LLVLVPAKYELVINARTLCPTVLRCCSPAPTKLKKVLCRFCKKDVLQALQQKRNPQ
jgi:hypothetical protein